MAYECTLKEYPTQPVLAVRTRSSVQQLPAVLGRVYNEIAGYLASHGGTAAGAPYVAYYNMDMADLDLEIGLPVAQPVPGTGDIQPGEIPAGRHATCLHVGPYHQISAAWESLGKWMEEKGYQPTGVGYEMYLNDPAETEPQALETEVAFPLRAS